ncbi:hypothetical protein OPV22_026856 [Ensete ventricosum]|uniref:Uncharacterized protein n=1 Tax=Ensete ventricosum TaxID=4639 RepID=A0AAV8Q5X6_ENSVE|nr:hypothetical protein OPV22_026856 [Ensete ventricosum]
MEKVNKDEFSWEAVKMIRRSTSLDYEADCAKKMMCFSMMQNEAILRACAEPYSKSYRQEPTASPAVAVFLIEDQIFDMLEFGSNGWLNVHASMHLLNKSCC